MISQFTFPLQRTHRTPTSWNKKRSNRPPSLNLGESFVKQNNKENQVAQAMRGSPSEHGDKEAETVPVKMRIEISMLGSRSFNPEHIQTTAEPPATELRSDTLVEEHMETIHGKNLEAQPKRSTSVQDSLRTFIQLGSDDSDSDPDIFSVSDSRPTTRSTSVLAQYFPEDSSNLHVASPSSADAADQKIKSPDYAMLLENEAHDRLSTFYKKPAVAEEGKKIDDSSPRSGKSRVSDPSDIFDGASSCYSQRTSLTSVSADGANERSPYKSADAYSIRNPTSAGVFDDAASVYSPGAPAFASPVASLRQSRRADNVCLPRTQTLPPRLAEELKNKPLPLEPVREPSPLAIRRSSPSSTEISPQDPSQYSLVPQRQNSHHPVAMRRQKSRELCRECGSHCESRFRRRHDYEQQMRRGPTLSQAAEELERALAELAKGSKKKQRTVLILDGPLQVSRHGGDLVATRPAPRPPPITPHSQSHRDGSLETRRSAKDKTGPSGKSHRAENTSKEYRPNNLQPNSEVSTEKEVAKAIRLKDSSTKKSIKTPKAEKQVRVHSTQSFKKTEKSKLKKSFTLSMLSFTLRNLNGRQDQGRGRRLGSRSGPSRDPPDNGEYLSHRLAPDSNLAPAKRDLLLQLPRLQTQDLETNKFESLTQAQEVQMGRLTYPAGLGSVNSAFDAARHPLLRVFPPEDEKILVAYARMRNNYAFVSTARASSVYMAPEQIYELDATPPSPTRPGFVRKNKRVPTNVDFPVGMTESLIVAIMERIESLDDLFNFVLVNKRIYMIFKARELYMIKSALFKMSPPAWELREMSPPWETEWIPLQDPDSRVPEYTPTTYLDRYASDIYTLARLKSMILVRCSPFLRRDTIDGLSGVDPIRLEEVDDAFWRIWTFCRIFGSGKGRENDLEGQVDWLRGGAKARNYMGATSTMTEPFGMNDVLFEPPEGFARGNCGGLSQKQMYDMTEIWTCLTVLLQPMHGNCAAARDVGIFDCMDIAQGDRICEESTLEEWTAYVLTLGLSAVVTLSSLCPAEATDETFEKAKSLGLTKWELTETEASRSSFLKEAVSRAYEAKERALSTQSNSPRDLTSRELNLANAEAERAREERNHAFKVELRTLRLRNARSNVELGTSFSNERPMSEFSTIIRNLDGSIRRTSVSVPEDAPTVPPVPPLIFERLSTSTTSSPPRTPKYTPPPSNKSDPSIPIFPRSPPHPTQLLAPPLLRPQVQDPVDLAMNKMVHELGFNENDVKWALKITDTGEGIDMVAAEQLLKKQKKKQLHNPFASRGKDSLLHSVIKRQKSQDLSWRWA
ncbi:uncharacterized protein N7498_004748 [Penicillium cinerascens]|uniref:Uncharacterized protein n=1 Tax=Penicillium cinerascens TaxID=70096 RepID=A0A9W9SZI7_9EURO|nr:uncharacterized protein N7498_004748 [Penicillium cinerascens]KAJ5203869.1 hypothetical protein N7498_004748 [Penicillium cinerascens]